MNRESDKNKVETAQQKLTVLLNLLLAVTITGGTLLFLGNAVTQGLGHDEHMYCTGGYLTAQGYLIYRDFSYFAQGPYHPLILGAIYKISGTSHYLLAARLFSVACDIGILICIAGFYRRILRPYPVTANLLAVLAIALYSMNEYIRDIAGRSWNHSMVVLCVLVSLWLWLGIEPAKKIALRYVCIGALLMLATFSRATTLLIWILFGLAIVAVVKGGLQARLKSAVPFILGSMLTLLWPVFVFLKAPQAYWLNQIKMPTLQPEVLRDIGLALDKMEVSFSAVTYPAHLVLIMIGGYLAISVFVRRRSLRLTGWDKELLILLTIGVFIVIAFVPPSMWPQYWAIPVSFILLSFAYPLRWLRSEYDKCRNAKLIFQAACYLIVTGVFICFCYRPHRTITSIAGVFDKSKWVPLQVHKISLDICEKAGDDKLALTMAPLYAIEGGCRIYRQFSAGPFVYRIAEGLNEREKQIVHAAGATDIQGLIDKHSAGVVILGTEPEILEEPILKQVVDRGWRREVYSEHGLVVYFRQSDDDGPDVK